MNLNFLLLISLTIILCWENVNCGVVGDVFCWSFKHNLPGADWCYGDEGNDLI